MLFFQYVQVKPLYNNSQLWVHVLWWYAEDQLGALRIQTKLNKGLNAHA